MSNTNELHNKRSTKNLQFQLLEPLRWRKIQVQDQA